MTVTQISTNCDPALVVGNETFFGVTEATGLQNPHVGTLDDPCDGPALLPAYDGHRGVEDVSSDGRHVLCVKAVCPTRDQNIAIPGKGVNNTLAIFDRDRQEEYELFPSTDFCGWSPKRHSIMWADFKPDLTAVSWTQRYKSGDLAGLWEARVADLDISTFTLSNERVWNPALNGSKDAFCEVYGWVPETNRIIITSNEGTKGGMLQSRLWTLDAATMRDKQPVDAMPGYHEFANWRQGHLLSSLTYKAGKGGVDLWDVFAEQRITYFNGDKGIWGNAKAIDGWPAPTYTNVLGGMFVMPDGSLIVGVARDLAVATVEAWRIG